MKKVFYILIAICMLFACNEDKGNYNYHEINTVDVSMEKVYPVRLNDDTTFIISPKLSQSLRDNEDNLSFTWLHSTVSHNFYEHGKYDTISTERDLRFHIDPNEENLEYEHYFRLNVFDKITDIEYPVNTEIKLVKAYLGTWMVLHEKNGQTELGSIEYIGGDILIHEDAYFEETGKRFQGQPLALMSYRESCLYYGSGSTWKMFFVFTGKKDEAGVYCQWEKFEKKDSLMRMIAPGAQVDFDFENITMADGDGKSGALIISNGQLYQCPRACKIYKPGSKLEGDVRIKFASKINNIALLYDELGHRFAYYYNKSTSSGSQKPNPLYFSESAENAQFLEAIPKRDGNVITVDPNALPKEQKVLYVGMGYSAAYGYAIATTDEKCFVYEFNTGGLLYSFSPSFNAYTEINLPKGMDENSCFASTSPYSGILFYSSGATLYRLDFKQAGGKATAIYTHPSGKIAKMKFAKRYINSIYDEEDYAESEFDLEMSLGISVDMEDGTSDFVILNLSSTGNVGADSEHYSATQVYHEFGKIADFVYM